MYFDKESLMGFWDGFTDCVERIVSDLADTFYSPFDTGYSFAYLLPVIVLALLFAAPAYADKRVILHGVSDHGDDGNYVERNWGVGVELDADQRSVCNDYVLGGYRNSHDDPAVYGLCSWDVGRAGRLSFDAQFGGVVGYVSVDSSKGDVGALPLVGVNTRAELPGPIDADLFVAPLIDVDDKRLSYVALLSASVPF